MTALSFTITITAYATLSNYCDPVCKHTFWPTSNQKKPNNYYNNNRTLEGSTNSLKKVVCLDYELVSSASILNTQTFNTM